MRQADRVLDFIQRYGSITTLQANRDLGVTQLAARIIDLKNEGYEFSKERRTVMTRFGDKVSVVVYRIKAQD